MEPLMVILPGEPVPAARPRADVRWGSDGKPIARVYMPAEHKNAIKAAQAAFDEQYPNAVRPIIPAGVPISVTARMVFSRPDAHYGTGRNAGILKPNAPHWCVTAPDVDNVLKLALDALQAQRATPSRDGVPGRIMHADSQVCRLGEIEKVYVGPGEVPHMVLWFDALPQRSVLGIEQLDLLAA